MPRTVTALAAAVAAHSAVPPDAQAPPPLRPTAPVPVNLSTPEGAGHYSYAWDVIEYFNESEGRSARY
eukprot:gene3735-876_t